MKIKEHVCKRIIFYRKALDIQPSGGLVSCRFVWSESLLGANKIECFFFFSFEMMSGRDVALVRFF